MNKTYSFLLSEIDKMTTGTAPKSNVIYGKWRAKDIETALEAVHRGEGWTIYDPDIP